MRTKTFLKVASAIFLMGSISGCTMTGNSHIGGIFWSPSKADQVLDQKKADLIKADDEKRHAQHNTDVLRGQRDDARMKRDEVRKKIAGLEQQKEQVANAPATGEAEKSREIAKLNAEIAKLKAKEKEFAEQSRL